MKANYRKYELKFSFWEEKTINIKKFVEYTEFKNEEKKKKINEKNLFSFLAQKVKEKKEKGKHFFKNNL